MKKRKAELTATFICFICFLSTPRLITGSPASYQNVYGEDLDRCSSGDMALSGYTRTGFCVNQNDDVGSHHICIDLSSTTGGNFCKVTGQPDWCSSYMQCDGYNKNENEAAEDSQNNGGQCQVQNWCVCQWAFASYVEAAGGCDAIQDVACESINAEAVKAYIKAKNSAPKYAAALDCLVERCGINLSLFDDEYNQGIAEVQLE